MGLIDTLIVTSCVGLSGIQQEACNKALTAGSKQSGIENNMNKAESKTLKTLETNSVQKNHDNSFVYNGIDRLDSDGGYTIKNTVTCCEFCNRAKFLKTKEEFLIWLNHVRRSSNGIA